jgi:hypothetical protein
VGNDDDREFIAQILDGLNYVALGIVVQGAGAIVKHDYVRLFADGARDTNALALHAKRPPRTDLAATMPIERLAMIDLRNVHAP